MSGCTRAWGSFSVAVYVVGRAVSAMAQASVAAALPTANASKDSAAFTVRSSAPLPLARATTRARAGGPMSGTPRSGQGAEEGERPGSQVGQRARHQGGDREGVDEGEDEDDGALTVPVRETAHEPPAGHLPDGERAADQPRRPQRAARARDEQQTAELDGGGVQTAEERHDREGSPGQRDHAAVGLHGGGRVRSDVPPPGPCSASFDASHARVPVCMPR